MDPRDARIAELEGEVAELKAVVVAKDARIQELEQMVATLTQQVATLSRQVEHLTERVNRNSRNSNLPPSSDPPGSSSGSAAKKSKRERGGQPGHRGKRRELVPESQVDEIVDLFPPHCENCWASLPEAHDPSAKRYQHTELPVIGPYTTEFRRHTVTCPGCGFDTCAAYDANTIPASPFGPRLMSVIALLTGIYHLSRRQTVRLLSDVVGIELSLGAVSAVEARVSDAVVPAVDEAWKKVEDAAVKTHRRNGLAASRRGALAMDDRRRDGHRIQDRVER